MNHGEKDLKVQIPTQAWITSFAVKDMDEALRRNPKISLEEYIEGQKGKTNIWKDHNAAFPICNLGSLLMMAYAFLVIPKESMERDCIRVSSPEINKLLNTMTIKENEINKGLDESESIIRHIRNSLSHARFDVTSEDELSFFDKDRQDRVTFDGKMKISDFKSLLSEYFKTFYEEYHKNYIVNSNQPVPESGEPPFRSLGATVPEL